MAELGKIFVSASGGIPPLSVSLDQAPSTFPGPADDSNPLYGWHSVPYTFTDIDEGLYRVYLQDSAGCIQSYRVSMSNAQYPTLSVHATPVSCYGAANGSLTGSLIGGTAPFTFSVGFPDGVEYELNNVNLFSLQTGSYNISVVDGAGCEYQEQFLITGPPTMNFSASANYTNAESTSIDFNGVSGTTGNTMFYVARYDRQYNVNSRPPFGNLLALYSSSTSPVSLPAVGNNLLAGGYYGAYMETLSDIANVTCSTDQQPVQVYRRRWDYRQSYCEQSAPGSNSYRILNFYRGRALLPTGVAPVGTLPSANRFLLGQPLNGVNIRIYTGSANEVNYDPNNITNDKLAVEFDTSGSLTYTGSFSYFIPQDLVVVMKNSATNVRHVASVTKEFSQYPPNNNDITASLTVTGSLLSGSTLNRAESDYFGNVGHYANTASLILTMSKENDEPQTRIINFTINSKYVE